MSSRDELVDICLCIQLNVAPPTVNDSSDMAKQPVKPLRSALRSTDAKVTNNDVPSKSDRNQSNTAAPDKSGRKVVDRKLSLIHI